MTSMPLRTILLIIIKPVSVVSLHLGLGEAAAPEKEADPRDDHGDDGPLLVGRQAALLHYPHQAPDQPLSGEQLLQLPGILHL